MTDKVTVDGATSTPTDHNANTINYDSLKRDAQPSQTRKVSPHDRYQNLSPNDRIVQALLNHDRSVADDLPEVNAEDYTPAADPPEVTQSDILISEHWIGMADPSDTYDSDIQTLEDTKFSLVKDALAGVDRGFVNPDNINNLGSLSNEQKAALLVDLLDIKQEYNGYMDQYGDSVPDGEAAGKAIDDRINALMADQGTQDYLSDLTSKVLKDYLTRPENAGMLQRLEMTYMEDIVGGKAVDRALAAGKSKEDALGDYLSELKTLTSILPSDFVEDKVGSATATYSKITNDMFMGDGTPGDLSAFTPDANGNNAAIDPVVQAMMLTFLGENAGNSKMFGPAIQVNYAQDVTRNFNSVIGLMRGGMKLDDALASAMKAFKEKPAPLGVENDAYKAGVAHAVQVLAASAVLVSRSLAPGQKWQAADIAGAMASAVQIVGQTTEGLAKNLDSAGKAFSLFGTASGSWGRNVASVINPKNLEAGGKILGGLGGLATAGLSFFSASRSLKAGDDPKAALEIISGTATLANSLIGFSEAAMQLTNIVPRVFNAVAVTTPEFVTQATSVLKYGLAVAGTATGLVASLAGMALGIWDMAKGVKKLDKLESDLDDKLSKYTGQEVHFEFGPDPSFIW
ncbi:hypothetical protein [Rhizobium paknamense]|uniref:Uncharacterized protein n=1 Tax=Rhizobium paknamense TaxID=1206817 RepID=A0ABU0I710_9HYPH|nr:hypothetical protein [Rhizobium paknamense]MDQ0454001.1 hypothetical protein [Rhizobium paknamense]